MSATDDAIARAATRWEGRYAAREHAARFAPDPLLVAHRHRLGGRVLDLACGEGSNALLAAMQGCDATGLDIACAAVRRARALARRLGVKARFASQPLQRWPADAADARPDAVLLFYYLDRAMCRRIVDVLAPGGIVIARTFNQAQLAHRPGFNPDFVLQRREWHTLFGGLVEVASSEGDGATRSAWFIGTKVR